MGTLARWFMAVTDKAAFIRHFKRLQIFVTVFAVVVFATASAAPRWMWLEWAIFMPVWFTFLWRFRCWNCHERLIKNGGANLEWVEVRNLSDTRLAERHCPEWL